MQQRRVRVSYLGLHQLSYSKIALSMLNEILTTEQKSSNRVRNSEDIEDTLSLYMLLQSEDLNGYFPHKIPNIMTTLPQPQPLAAIRPLELLRLSPLKVRKAS